MRILVSGATGFIARSLLPLLLDNGHDVVGISSSDLSRSDKKPAWGAGVRFLQVDLSNREAISAALRQVRPQIVIHLAAAGVSHPFLPVAEGIRHNVTGAVNLLQATFEESQSPPVERLVVGRTPGERSAMNPYAASKAAAWQFCRMYARTRQWPIVGAVIFQAYGPFQKEANLIPSVIRAARQGHDFPMTKGKQERDWIYVEDVARGILSAAVGELQPGQSVELGTGHATSVASVATLIYDQLGAGGRPLPGALSARPGEESVQIANLDRHDWSKYWRANYSLKEGLRRTIQWYAHA